MGIFELLLLVGQDDSVVDDGDVHLKFSLVDGFEGDFFFLGRETDLEKISPDLGTVDLPNPFGNVRVVVGYFVVALVFALLYLVVLVEEEDLLLERHREGNRLVPLEPLGRVPELIYRGGALITLAIPLLQNVQVASLDFLIL